jgi:pimeloyl-ACP methyl ester carboxylesterase
MSAWTRVLSLIVITVLVFAGCGTPSGSGRTTNRPSAFTTTPCSFTVGGAFLPADVRCGYLSVPENRQSDNSRTIRLAVAVFKAPLANPAPDPLIYVEGGPGSQLIRPMAPSIIASGMPNYVGNRDLILVDQRGVGLSKPSLACRQQETLQQCHARLVKDGIDLSAYNTVENAADIAELGPALGYKQVNLFGNSYGTSLTLQVMRDYPQGIRSVVMDGITGPTFDVFNDYNAHTWQSFQQVFQDCAASSSCNSEYPRLQQTFTQLLARLQAHPVTIRVYSSALHRSATGKLNGVAVWNGLREILADPRSVPQVPQMIASVARGDYR